MLSNFLEPPQDLRPHSSRNRRANGVYPHHAPDPLPPRHDPIAEPHQTVAEYQSPNHSSARDTLVQQHKVHEPHRQISYALGLDVGLVRFWGDGRDRQPEEVPHEGGRECCCQPEAKGGRTGQIACVYGKRVGVEREG